MILQALTRYYEVLLAQGRISAPGWGKAKVSFGLELAEDGTLLDVVSFLTEQAARQKDGAGAPCDGGAHARKALVRAWRRIFCATIPAICLAPTPRGSRSAQKSALKPAVPCTSACWPVPAAPPRAP